MKQLTQHAITALSAGVFVIFVASSAQAVDHNNIDANRPLSFDDAESISLGEQSLEVGVRGGEEKGIGPIVSTGIGLRQQVGYQNVLDIGLRSDIAGGNGGRDDVRFVVGYSTAF